MNPIRRFLAHWRSRREHELEMEQEFRFHIEMAVERNIRNGLTPVEARRRALRDFGGVERHKEVVRERRATAWLDILAQDVRYALRMMRSQPGFTATVVITLVLGIGATTAMFSVVNGVLLRSLPFPDPQEIVFLGWNFGEAGKRNPNLTPLQMEMVRQYGRTFQGVATFAETETDIGPVAAERTLRGLRVSEDFFSVTGIRPTIGREFTDEENRIGGPDAVVLGFDAWRREFASDSGVLGRTLRVQNRLHRVVGVMPPNFLFPNRPENTDFLVPMRLVVDARDEGQNLEVFARARPGVSHRALAADLDVVIGHFRSAHPDLVRSPGASYETLTFKDIHAGGVETTLWILLGAVSCLLVIACANCANLLVARGVAREREMAVRAALGAGRSRVFRQLLTEGALLATLAAVLGAGVGFWALQTILAMAPRALPRANEIGVDLRVLAVTIGIAGACAMVFALVAAWPILRLNVVSALADRTGTATPNRVRELLVGTETAFAVVLLVCATLLVTSFVRLRAVDPGFAIDDVSVIRFGKPPSSYAGPARTEFERRLLERLRSLPGIHAAGIVNSFPMERGLNLPVTVEGMPDRSEGSVEVRPVTAGALEALQIRLIGGRLFGEQDFGKGLSPVVVSESFARHFFPGENAIGRRIEINRWRGNWFGEARQGSEIVGVVGDVRDRALDREPRWTVYAPRLDAASRPLLVVRGAERGVLVREVHALVRSMHPDMPLPRVQPLADLISASAASQRYQTTLMVLIGGTGLVLTLIGIFGVVAYAVKRRVREIGIRLALGATPSAVTAFFVSRGMMTILAGGVVGIAGAVAASRLLQGMLFGITPLHPTAYLGAATVLLLSGLAACYLSARRAARVDPALALRRG